MLKQPISYTSDVYMLRIIGLLGVSVLQLFATATAPIGFNEYRIAGTGGQVDRARTYIAVPMLGRETETGVIARVDGMTIHLQSSTLLDQDAPASSSTRSIRSSYADTHYLQIVKGPRTGYHADLAGGDADSLQTTQDLSAILQPGDAYQVRPYTTLTALLGPNNRKARLYAAETFAQADQIFIPDPQSGQLAAYFYQQQGDTGPLLAHRDGRPVQTEPILYPGSGFMISRIAEGDTELFTTGDVQTHATIIPVESGINFIASTFPVDTTLAEFLGPHAGNFTEEDAILLPREFGRQDQYRLMRTTNGGALWLPNGEAPPAEQATIPAGSVVILHRQGKPFNLKLERPFEL